jgi:GNAT superfamily N-acetyltransferase
LSTRADAGSPQARTVLRPAKEADAAAIAELFIASRRVHIPYAPLAHTVEETRGWVEGTLVPSGGVTVYERGGSVVGFSAVSARGDCTFVEHMYVSPQEVGHGIGTALLRHILAVAEPPIRLYTFQANSRARAFYERFGFVPVRFGDGSDNEERCPDVLYELPQ